MTGRLRVDPARLLRFTIVTVLLTAATIGGLRVTFSSVLRQEFAGEAVVAGMRPRFAQVEARVLPAIPEPDEAASQSAYPEGIRRRGVLRVCVLPDRLPYAYKDRQGALVGFDIEMAHRLGRDLGVRLEFVEVTLEQVPATLDAGGCDIAMAGTPVTPLRASLVLFSAPYFDETLGWLVRDHLRDRFATWDAIRALGPMRVGAPDVPYYVDEVRERAPALQIETFAVRDALPQLPNYDALLLPAERAAVITMLHPEFAVVVPQPDVIKVPLAYPISSRDARWETFINTWIELKRRDGTIDKLYRHWILGQDAVARTPRWSVVRNVLGWVE